MFVFHVHHVSTTRVVSKSLNIEITCFFLQLGMALDACFRDLEGKRKPSG